MPRRRKNIFGAKGGVPEVRSDRVTFPPRKRKHCFDQEKYLRAQANSPVKNFPAEDGWTSRKCHLLKSKDLGSGFLRVALWEALFCDLHWNASFICFPSCVQGHSLSHKTKQSCHDKETQTGLFFSEGIFDSPYIRSQRPSHSLACCCSCFGGRWQGEGGTSWKVFQVHWAIFHKRQCFPMHLRMPEHAVTFAICDLNSPRKDSQFSGLVIVAVVVDTISRHPHWNYHAVGGGPIKSIAVIMIFIIITTATYLPPSLFLLPPPPQLRLITWFGHAAFALTKCSWSFLQ